MSISNDIQDDTDDRNAQSDSADVAATLNGDGDAFRRLVQRHQQTIANQMRRFSRDSAVCEELVHDVFVEAWQSLPRFRGKSPWLHWLRRIAIRVGYRHWRRLRKTNSERSLNQDDWRRLPGDSLGTVESFDAAEWIHAVLSRLRPSDRLVLTLVYLEGCTMQETASLTGWTVPGTKVRAFRARNRLRKLLEREMQ